VLGGPAEREDEQAVGSAIDELTAQVRGDANQLTTLEHMLLTPDDQRQRSLEYEVDLLLARMTVDAASLTGLERELVDAERRDAQLSTQGHEPLARIGVEPRARDARFHANGC
jgi:hypothetical protein